MVKATEELASEIAARIVSDGWSPFTITSDGVTDSVEYAPDVYWQSGEAVYCDDSRWDVVADFHPSESITEARHVRYHLGGHLEDLGYGAAYAVVCAEIVDPDDPEALVGWALLTRPMVSLLKPGK